MSKPCFSLQVWWLGCTYTHAWPSKWYPQWLSKSSDKLAELPHSAPPSGDWNQKKLDDSDHGEPRYVPLPILDQLRLFLSWPNTMYHPVKQPGWRNSTHRDPSSAPGGYHQSSKIIPRFFFSESLGSTHEATRSVHILHLVLETTHHGWPTAGIVRVCVFLYLYI